MSKKPKRCEHDAAEVADTGPPTCVLVPLPSESERIAAAEQAKQINPQNAPSGAFLGLLGAVLPPGQLAILTGKKWGPKVDLGVTFLDTNDTTLVNRILAHANVWGETGNVRFRQSSQGEIRLSRSQGGYWSYLGTDALSIGRGQPTLNLEGFSMNTPEGEYRRVVRHEFGHALGFPHEHSRPEIIALLDFNKTAAEFRRLYGWSSATVREQIFEPLSPSEIQATNPDALSIMCYQFSGNCTKNGQPIPGGLDLDPADRQFVGVVYPKDVQPPPPPPPPSGNLGSVAVDMDAKTVTVPAGWKLAAADVGEQIVYNLAELPEASRRLALNWIDDAARDFGAPELVTSNDGKTVSGTRPPSMAGRDWSGFAAFILAIINAIAALKK